MNDDEGITVLKEHAIDPVNIKYSTAFSCTTWEISLHPSSVKKR
jgi:hypothetical protein